MVFYYFTYETPLIAIICLSNGLLSSYTLALQLLAPRALHAWHRTQRCALQRGIKNVGPEQSLCWPNAEYYEPYAPILTPN